MPSRLSISWKLLFFLGVLDIVFGSDFFLSGFILGSDPIVGIYRNPTKIDIPYSMSYGIALTGLGVLTCAVTWKSYRHGERWAWFALLVAGLTVYFEGTLVNLSVGGPLIYVILFIIFAFAIYLPAREILSKDAGERGTSQKL